MMHPPKKVYTMRRREMPTPRPTSHRSSTPRMRPMTRLTRKKPKNWRPVKPNDRSMLCLVKVCISSGAQSQQPMYIHCSVQKSDCIFHKFLLLESLQSNLIILNGWYKFSKIIYTMPNNWVLFHLIRITAK